MVINKCIHSSGYAAIYRLILLLKPFPLNDKVLRAVRVFSHSIVLCSVYQVDIM